MVRSTSPLALVLTLALGISLGLNFQQNPRTVSAQARPPAPIASPSEDVGPAPVSGGIRGSGEGGVYGQLARQYAQFEHVNRTFELVAERSRPRWSTSSPRSRAGATRRRPRPRSIEETGSGVIVRSERGSGLYVLTNNHVVEGAAPAKIRIFLHDGRSLHPDRIWTDAKADIAVLKLGPRRPARRPAGQQRRRARSGTLGAGPGQPVRPDALGQPGDHQRPGPAHGRARRTSRTRTSSRPTRRSTRATRAGRWST